ncbi:hypothetical protein RR48_08877 [Papilio machaon]|uniref:Uncharacterized protein n=1 Tax=Papilio machaon TaxID=76193 RepID=A0A194R0Q6_PAPMA|nr:hypothetical protein RR48_08877 [Papilio machaon]
MTIPRDNSENPPCSQCRLLRKSFVLIAMSAVIPIIVFSALLLLMDVGNMDMEYRSLGSVIIESVAGILHVQLFVATALLIASISDSPNDRDISLVSSSFSLMEFDLNPSVPTAHDGGAVSTFSLSSATPRPSAAEATLTTEEVDP